MATVMIVDDDQFLHKVLNRILSIGGHKVIESAYNGVDAIEKYVALDTKPDLVLMDHRMPIMNGTVATKEILEIDQKAKILFISADGTVMDEAIAAGAIGFLTKPIRSEELFSAIEQFGVA